MSNIEVGSVWVNKINDRLTLTVTHNYCKAIKGLLSNGRTYNESPTTLLLHYRPETIDECCNRKNQELKDDMSTIYDQPTSAPQAASKMRLIGIAGQARSGKDTLASYLLDNLDNNWTRSSFADPLKAMLSVIGVDCSDDAKAVIDDSYGVTPRHMMQTLGTEWGRNLIDNDIWVKAFARLNAGMCVIVPDVRFENEADLVRQHGVLIHLVGRGGIEGSHVSENPIAFMPGDIVIDNSRDLAWLHAQVDGNAVLGGFLGDE